MTNTAFNRFRAMYDDGTIEDDVTWRGYHIAARAATRPSYERDALKKLGLSYAREHAFSQFMKLYEIRDADLAHRLLACWYIWSEVANGRRVHGLLTRSVKALEATTLPEK